MAFGHQKGSCTRKLSEVFPKQSFMEKDEAIDQIIEAIAEDFTFAEFLHVSYMRRELDKLIQIEHYKLVPLLFGALQLKTLRRGAAAA